MLEELRVNLKDWVSSSRTPVLAWSGGKDSSLLLQLMLEDGLKFSILTLHHLWSRPQRKFVVKLIEKHGLTTFFYSPTSINNHGEYVTLDYNLGGTVVRKIMDVESDDRCGIDAGRDALRDALVQPRYIWDLTIVGTKKSDEHQSVTAFNFVDTPGHRFLTPLWGWTDEQVVAALKDRGYEFDETEDTGTFKACMNCLNSSKKVYCPKINGYIKGVK